MIIKKTQKTLNYNLMSFVMNRLMMKSDVSLQLLQDKASTLEVSLKNPRRKK